MTPLLLQIALRVHIHLSTFLIPRHLLGSGAQVVEKGATLRCRVLTIFTNCTLQTANIYTLHTIWPTQATTYTWYTACCTIHTFNCTLEPHCTHSTMHTLHSALIVPWKLSITQCTNMHQMLPTLAAKYMINSAHCTCILMSFFLQPFFDLNFFIQSIREGVTGSRICQTKAHPAIAST